MDINVDDDLIELPGDLMTDRAAVSIFKYVSVDELDQHIRQGWVVSSDEGDLFRLRMDVEEYGE
jgi:hypothetical protein